MKKIGTTVPLIIMGSARKCAGSHGPRVANVLFKSTMLLCLFFSLFHSAVVGIKLFFDPAIGRIGAVLDYGYSLINLWQGYRK